MRISCLKDDPGFALFAQNLNRPIPVQTRVYVDGELILAPYTADEELGFCLCAKARVNRKGNIEVMKKDNGDVVTEIIKGRVRIEIAEGRLQ